MTQVPFIGGLKTVLLLTDDDVGVYRMSGNGAELAGRVSWDEGNFVDKVLAVIVQRCGSKPLVVINDMSEQFYKVDKIPVVRNPLDRTSMLKRKLVAAFPQYKVTGALLQQDKLKGQKPSNFRAVLAAIPSSQKIQRVNNILNYSGLQILSVGLLPVESASMVSAVSDSLNKNKDKSKNNWTVFIAQNSNGGLRQIVTKNEHMALTRMTPLVNTDADPEVWASEVSQELKATMTYLTRFDYKQDDNLEVVVVSNPTSGQILEGLVEFSCNFYSLTVSQVAERLKIGLPDPEESRFIDPIHVRWAANKASFDMDMKAEDVQKISQARMGAIAASIVMIFSLLYFAGQAYATYDEVSAKKKDIVKARAEKARADEDYSVAVKDKADDGVNIDLVKGTVDSYVEFENRGLDPVLYIQKINKAMRPFNQTFSSVSMTFKADDKNTNSFQPAARGAQQKDETQGDVVISLAMVFPGSIRVEDGNAQVEKIRLALEREFKDIGFEVEIAKLLRDLTFQEEFKGSAGISSKEQRNEKTFNSEIKIIGGGS